MRFRDLGEERSCLSDLSGTQQAQELALGDGGGLHCDVLLFEHLGRVQMTSAGEMPSLSPLGCGLQGFTSSDLDTGRRDIVHVRTFKVDLKGLGTNPSAGLGPNLRARVVL